MTHTPTPSVQHNTIHTPTSVYNTKKKYVHRLQHNEYICNDTKTTQCTYIVPHACNTTCTKCVQYDMYTSTIYTCTGFHILTMPLVQSCTQHHMHNMYRVPHAHNVTCTIMHTTPYVHSTTCTTCTQHHMYNRHTKSYVHNTTYETCT